MRFFLALFCVAALLAMPVRADDVSDLTPVKSNKRTPETSTAVGDGLSSEDNAILEEAVVPYSEYKCSLLGGDGELLLSADCEDHKTIQGKSGEGL